MATNRKKDELEAALDRAVGTGASAGENLGAYKDANGNTTTYRPEFAGQTVQMGNQYVTYNERGYPEKATSVSHAQKLGNAYTSQNMGLDQSQIANAGDIYHALYNQSMNNGTFATGSLANAFGKQNIQYDSTLGRSDYEALIQDAAAKGNNVLAGFYEDSLNALLSSLGLNGQMSSTYNGGWNYVDNGGGVGNIYAGAMADPLQTNQALGGGWYAGQGLGDAAEEYYYRNNDFPTMQEVLAYAASKGYDTEDDSVTIPLGDLAREMVAGGYVSPNTQKSLDTLGVALPNVLKNLGLSADNGIGTDALQAAIQSMRQGSGGEPISDEVMQMLYQAAAAQKPSANNSYVSSNLVGGKGNNSISGSVGQIGTGNVDVNDMIQQLLGMNYNDWTKGDAYAGLEDRYSDFGRQAMQNTLGQISSRTGGLASSYATTAANQQYNNYMSILEDVARQMYSGERSDLLENVGLLRDIEQDAYNRQQDALDREYMYQQDAYNKQQAAQNEAFNRQMAAAELMASIGDYSGYKALGLTDAQIAALGNAYTAANAPKANPTAPVPQLTPKEELVNDLDTLANSGEANRADMRNVINSAYNQGLITSKEKTQLIDQYCR